MKRYRSTFTFSGLIAVAIVMNLTTFHVRAMSGAATLVVDDDLACPGATFATISAAVTAAASGDTIQVCAGTYTENVFLSKSITLRGAQSGIDARGRVAGESILLPANALMPTVNIAASGTFAIDGFSFSGGPASASGAVFMSVGPNNGLQIVNNRFSNYAAAAVWLNHGGSDITIDRNVLDGSNIAGNGQAIFLVGAESYAGLNVTSNWIINNSGRYGLVVDGNHNVGESATRAALISGNLVDNNFQGMDLGSRSFGTLGTPVLGAYAGTISGNTFSNHLGDGIQGGVQHVLVTQNTFRNNGRNAVGLTNSGPAGTDRGAQFSDVTCNLIIGNGALNAGSGVFLGATQAAGTIATNRVNNNNLRGNRVGLTHQGVEAAPIDATNNWWGKPTGPTIASNPAGTGDSIDNASGNVTYAPFLTSPPPCAPADPEAVQKGTITVHKTVDSGGASVTSFCFTLSPDPGNGLVCANASGDAIFSNVPAGSYGATESAVANYHQVSNSCSALIIATQGDSRICDVHNALNTGTVTVHKTVDTGGAAATSFCFTLSPDPGKGQVCANAAGNAVFSNVPAGIYSAAETQSLATYHQASSTCAAVTIAQQGDAPTCEVHNALNTGTIRVHKTVDSGSAPATVFCFTLSPNPGIGQVCANAAGDATFNGVPVGVYSAVETARPAAYRQISNTCTSLSIAVQGDSLACDVHDAITTGTITVHKVLDAGTSPLTAFCFTLSPNPGTGQVCANAAGDAVFTGVPAGSYGVQETASPATFHQVSSTCAALSIATQGDARSCTVHDSNATTAARARIAIDKQGPGLVQAGAPATYTYLVKNTGGVPLTAVTVIDSKCASPAYVSGDAGVAGVLDTGETWTFSCTYTPVFTPSADLTNRATAAASAGGQLVSATDTFTLHPITIKKVVYVQSDRRRVPQPADTTSFTVGVYKGTTLAGTFAISQTTPLQLWIDGGTFTVKELNLPAGYTLDAPLTISSRDSCGTSNTSNTLWNRKR